MSKFLSAEYRKFQVAAVTALATLGTLLPDGLTGSEVIVVVLAFAGALGVKAATNEEVADG